MQILNYQPESLEEIAKKAKDFAIRVNKTVVVYRDYDFEELTVYCYCSENVFDEMLDCGEVESNWIEVVVNPE